MRYCDERQRGMDTMHPAVKLSSEGVLEFLRTDTLVEGNKIIERPFSEKTSLERDEICLYRVKQLSFDEEYPHREAFENVLRSLDNKAFNLIYMLSGDESRIQLCIGVARNQNENETVMGERLSAVNYGDIVAKAFEGNFGGSELEKLTGAELTREAFESAERYKNAGVIVGIPSVNQEDTGNSKYGFQGIDRLINSMLGLRWRVIVVCEPISQQELVEQKNRIYDLYNELTRCAKLSVQNAQNENRSEAKGKNQSRTENVSHGRSDTKNHSENKQHGGGDSTGTNTGRSTSYSENTGKTSGTSTTTTTSMGSSRSVTFETVNKKAQEILKYIDEELLERVKRGSSRGMFKTSIYYMAEKPTEANRLKSGVLSLFQGNKSTYSPLQSFRLDMGCSGLPQLLRSYQSPFVRDDSISSHLLTLMSRPFHEDRLWLNTYLTTDEVSLIAGLPQKEVPGIVVTEGVDFGLNYTRTNGEIRLGSLMQKGRILQNMPVGMEGSVLNKHLFIAGVTGSGKTTTCHRLLREARMPFLVLEPAKTEYRILLHHKDFRNLVIFTVGNEQVAPFRLNPFELVQGELVGAHIDMLKATFTSAFPMEAAMPQILEEAIYACYEKKGWDVAANENWKCKKEQGYQKGDEYTDKYDTIPNFNDLLDEMKKAVDAKGFGDRLGGEYSGSLIARFSNLTKGVKGAILNCRKSIDFDELAEQNVIIEMEELKSSEDKALLMGFILARLTAVIRNKHRKNPKYRHITLVEEAHRLLSKTEYGDSGSKKAAVETFTDLLAEVRKYGEGLIIVDQIPNKLAPEVLKNTNTKIIHKLFARDDKEAVGDTMLMDDKQKEYLSALEAGQAVLFTEGMRKPVQIKVDYISDTSSKEVEDREVRERYCSMYADVFVEQEIVRQLYDSFWEMLQGIRNNLSDSSYITEETRGSVEQFHERAEVFMMRHTCNIERILHVLTFRNRQIIDRDEEYAKRLYKFMYIVWKDGCSEEKNIIKDHFECICKLHL